MSGVIYILAVFVVLAAFGAFGWIGAKLFGYYQFAEWAKSHSDILTKTDLDERLKKLMSALTDEFQKIRDDIVEGTTELTTKIEALEESLKNDNISAESRTVLDEVGAAAKVLAGIVPNAEARKRSKN